jgi:hypothetical protein
MGAIVEGMCWGHYARKRRGVPMDVQLAVKGESTKATVVRYGCRRPTGIERRWSQFRFQLEEMVTPEPTTGCLLWMGRHYPSGYGKIGYHRDPWGGYAHRAVLFFAGVDLRKGDEMLVARHICNNPACVSIDHIRAGTSAENAADRELRYTSGDLSWKRRTRKRRRTERAA